MRFTLSEDQQEIKRTAHDLLANRSTMAKVREAAEAGTYDDALGRELGELGWPGIAVGEEHGGQGLGIVELCVLLEELGYACAPVPFLGSALAALAIEHAGSSAQQERWLPGLASGELRGALGTADALTRRAGADVVVVVDAAAAPRTWPTASRRSSRSTRRAATVARPAARRRSRAMLSRRSTARSSRSAPSWSASAIARST